MRRQRNVAQMKEQNKTPEKELNRMETSNPLDAEFKPLLIRMLKERSENLKSIKKIQAETKNELIQIKKNLQGNSRVDEAEIQINNLEYKGAKNNSSEQKEEKRNQKNEDSVRSLLTTSSIPTFTLWRCRKDKRERNWKPT